MKNINILNSACGLLAVLAAAVFLGCSIKMAVRSTNTQFVYPNSNVTPLGLVSAKSPQSVTIFMPKMFDAKEIDEVTQKALAQKGGDILVNSKIVVKTMMIPIMLPIMISSLEISGTAAKMTVGKKELH